MASFDVSAFIARFAERADAVQSRGIPPLEGEARRAYIAVAQQDFTDFSLIADAEWSVEENELVLRIPLDG